MKKGLFILSLLCVSSLIMAQEVQDDEDLRGVHPYKIEQNESVSHKLAYWSLTPHIGFNAFDGDFSSEMKHPVWFPSAGLDLEFHFTPVWGLGIEYMFSRYGVTGKPGKDNADVLLAGFMHKGGLYLSMDFINLFFPRAKRKIFSAQGILTGGGAWYRNTAMYNDDARQHTASYVWPDGSTGPHSMKSYDGVGFLGGGLNLEFNLNRSLALGVRAVYHYFLNDYVDNRGITVASKNNDGLVDVTLNMRIKIRPEHKSHVRNITNEEIYVLPPDPCYVHDTVVYYRDTVILRERIIEQPKPEKQPRTNQYYYVYFDNNEYKLNNEGYVTVQQVADLMLEDENLYAVVTGFCDNTGSDSLNYILGDKRAASVLNELRNEHGVAEDHLYSMGMGKVTTGRGKQVASFGPNRRAMIRLVDEETFNRMKMDLDLNHDVRETNMKTVSLSESARKAQANVYKDRPSETVKATKNTTLSKLARQYYNNIYCWVYIYMANVDRIENPHTIAEGTELVIPELTEEELAITREASLELYGSARKMK